MTETKEPKDLALELLMGEFRDLDLKRQQADRDAHRYSRETRWTRLVTWLREHPGEELLLEGIHSNSVQRLKKRFPGLRVRGEKHRFVKTAMTKPGSKGKKICDLVLMWPKVEEPDA